MRENVSNAFVMQNVSDRSVLIIPAKSFAAAVSTSRRELNLEVLPFLHGAPFGAEYSSSPVTAESAALVIPKNVMIFANSERILSISSSVNGGELGAIIRNA